MRRRRCCARPGTPSAPTPRSSSCSTRPTGSSSSTCARATSPCTSARAPSTSASPAATCCSTPARTPTEVMPLGFGRSRFRFAAPVGSDLTIDEAAGPAAGDLLPGPGRAPTWPSAASRVRLIPLDGAVETAIRLGVADVDRRRRRDRHDAAAGRAGAVRRPDPAVRGDPDHAGPRAEPPTGFDQLERRLNGVLVARNYVMMDYDVSDAVDDGLRDHPGSGVADRLPAGQGGLARGAGDGAARARRSRSWTTCGRSALGRSWSPTSPPAGSERPHPPRTAPVTYRSRPTAAGRAWWRHARSSLPDASVGWFALPPDLRALFTVSQSVTLLLILGFLVRVRSAGPRRRAIVRADEDGLRSATGCVRTVIAWSRVHKVMLRPGRPLGALLLIPADGRPRGRTSTPRSTDADGHPGRRRCVRGRRRRRGAARAGRTSRPPPLNGGRIARAGPRCRVTYSIPRFLSSASISAMSSIDVLSGSASASPTAPVPTSPVPSRRPP